MQSYSRTLNLIGTGCPMNFVLIKSTLDRMQAGELLQVFLDKAPLGPDVAENLSAGGYDVLSIGRKNEATEIVVRKRSASPGAATSTRRGRPCKGCGGSRRKRRV
jgi:TusA-related sulfurtransferase